MKSIDNIAELLRSAIVALDEVQKKMAQIPAAEDPKENLLKEFITLSFSGAENALLGANMLLVNVDTTDEEVLRFAVEQSKALINNLNRLPL